MATAPALYPESNVQQLTQAVRARAILRRIQEIHALNRANFQEETRLYHHVAQDDLWRHIHKPGGVAFEGFDDFLKFMCEQPY